MSYIKSKQVTWPWKKNKRNWFVFVEVSILRFITKLRLKTTEKPVEFFTVYLGKMIFEYTWCILILINYNINQILCLTTLLYSFSHDTQFWSRHFIHSPPLLDKVYNRYNTVLLSICYVCNKCAFSLYVGN